MVFQTAHSESARAALDIANQLQREEGFRKLLADRMAEDGKAVKSVAESNALRAEERQERQRRSANQSGKEKDDDGRGDGDRAKRADSADGSLDLMA